MEYKDKRKDSGSLQPNKGCYENVAPCTVRSSISALPHFSLFQIAKQLNRSAKCVSLIWEMWRKILLLEPLGEQLY
uniref:Uncharacterized protein n=1 Tax=Cucumis sativus TaxID=3659 RepID=A0A0A0LF32_CUCSA